MNIINKSSLREFWEIHPDAKKELLLWWNDVRRKQWKNPHEVKRDFVSASIIKNNRIVFNVCWNKYRLIVECNYFRGSCYIRFIGTHAQYDKADANTVNQFLPKKKT